MKEYLVMVTEDQADLVRRLCEGALMQGYGGVDFREQVRELEVLFTDHKQSVRLLGPGPVRKLSHGANSSASKNSRPAGKATLARPGQKQKSASGGKGRAAKRAVSRVAKHRTGRAK